MKSLEEKQKDINKSTEIIIKTIKEDYEIKRKKHENFIKQIGIKGEQKREYYKQQYERNTKKKSKKRNMNSIKN